MTEYDLKKLSRADLLEMLIDQGEELQAVKEKLAGTEARLQQKELVIEEAGSIAEASLKLNGVFDAAQAACQQYMDNIISLSDRQKKICERLEKESREEATSRIDEAKKQCETMEQETKKRCDEMLNKAKEESEAYWDEVSKRLEAFFNEHTGLRELLAISLPKKNQE